MFRWLLLIAIYTPITSGDILSELLTVTSMLTRKSAKRPGVASRKGAPQQPHPPEAPPGPGVWVKFWNNALPYRELTYPTWEKTNHLQKRLLGEGYVSSQEGTHFKNLGNNKHGREVRAW